MLGTPWVLAWSVAASSLGAQERVATAGRVLDQLGKPMAGATVSLVGSVPPHRDRFEPADYHEVKSDAKGRFQVKLLAHGEYSAWAVGPVGADGSYVVSELHHLQPGAGVEIPLRDQREATFMPIAGLDAWPDLGPLRVEVGLATDTVHRVPVDVLDGVVTLPPRPNDMYVMVFVLTRDGEVLCADTVMRPDWTLPVPWPEATRVRVRDKQGNAVAGATIRMEFGWSSYWPDPKTLGGPHPLTEWRVVATTDAAGEAVVDVPVRKWSQYFPARFSMMVASKRGYRASCSGFLASSRVVDGVTVEGLPEHGVLPFTLEKAETWSGRIMGRDGRPAANLPLEVSAQMKLSSNGGRSREYATAFRTTTSADGTFQFEELPKGFEDVLLHVGMPSSEAGVSRRAAAFLKPRLDRPLLLDLGTLRALDLQVVDSRGVPARNAYVLLLPVPIGQRKLDASTHVLRLDNRGRASVPVQPGAWQVMVTDRIGLGWKVLNVIKDQTVSLKLDELQVLSGTLLVDADAPYRHMEFGIASETSSAVPMHSGIVRSIGTPLNRWLLAGSKIAADGAFTLRFVTVDKTVLWVSGFGWLRFPLVAGSGMEFDLRKK